MRIAIISTPFVPVPPPRYGGTELIVASLVEALVMRGHDVTLYATGDSRMRGVDLRYLYGRAVWPPDPTQELNHAAFAVRDIAGDPTGYDIVHTHVAPTLALGSFIDAPVVYTLHHARDEALNELYQACQSSTLTMVAISERQRVLLGADLALRTHVVHHGLHTEIYPLGPGGPRVAFLGRFAEEKGVHMALDVAHHAGVPIQLAGKPHWKDEAYFRAEVEPRLARPGVVWTGEASHEPKVALLGGSLATLFPIDWEEPFGLVMIESMLCGTPVLSFPRGAASEVIDPGVTGWIVRDTDEMAWRVRKLADGRIRFDRARCRARAAARFSVERMVLRYLSIYAEAAGKTFEPRLAHRDALVSTWPLS